jgi:NADPH-dependent ferric siderophore reductase
VTDADAQRITALVADATGLPAVFGLLDDSGIALAEVSLRKSSLARLSQPLQAERAARVQHPVARPASGAPVSSRKRTIYRQVC